MGTGCRPEADKRIRNNSQMNDTLWKWIWLALWASIKRKESVPSTDGLPAEPSNWMKWRRKQDTPIFPIFSKGKICFNETAKVISVISCLPPAAKTLIRNTGHFFAPTAGKTNFQYFSRWQRSPTRSAFTLRMIDRPLSPSYLSRFLFKLIKWHT